MKPVGSFAVASALGVRSESTGKSDDSHRKVRCGINSPFTGSWLLASHIGRVAFSFRADRVVDTYFLPVDSQRDEKPNHETHAQHTQGQHGVGRGNRNCIRLKHGGLTPHWIM